MRKLIATMLLLAMSFFGATIPSSASKTQPKFESKTIEQMYNATGILYAINPMDNEYHRVCTIWNYEKSSDGYIAISASHCATIGDMYPQSGLTFGVSYAEPTNPPDVSTIVPAKLLEFGDMTKADDIAVWDIQTKDVRPILPLGDSKNIKMGEELLNVSIPFDGIAKGCYRGTVTNPKVQYNDPEIKGMVFVDMFGTGPGSSGSAVVSERTHKVVGILTMGENSVGELLVPVSVIRAFLSGKFTMHEPGPAITAPPQDNDDDAARIGRPTPMQVSTSVHVSPPPSHPRPPVVRPPAQQPKPSPKPKTHGKSQDHKAPKRDPRTFGPNDHRYIGDRDVRIVEGGRVEIFWGGWWFWYPQPWPAWCFEDEIYFIEIGPNIFEVIDFSNPTAMIQVTIILE